MKVEPANAAAEIEHGGHTYYFCSKHCADKFNADPARYAAKAPTPATAAATKYTCPMHPEIVQIGPGSCPKCGMALVPVAGAAAENENPELRDHTQRFYVTAAPSIPLVFISMAPMLGAAHPLCLGPAARGYL